MLLIVPGGTSHQKKDNNVTVDLVLILNSFTLSEWDCVLEYRTTPDSTRRKIDSNTRWRTLSNLFDQKSWSEKKSNLVWVHLDDKAWGWSQLISQCLEFNCRAVALLATESIWRKERVRWPNRAPTKWSHSPKSAEHFVHEASHLNLSLLSFSDSSLAPSPLWWDFEQIFRCLPSK